MVRYPSHSKRNGHLSATFLTRSILISLASEVAVISKNTNLIGTRLIIGCCYFNRSPASLKLTKLTLYNPSIISIQTRNNFLILFIVILHFLHSYSIHTMICLFLYHKLLRFYCNFSKYASIIIQ